MNYSELKIHELYLIPMQALINLNIKRLFPLFFITLIIIFTFCIKVYASDKYFWTNTAGGIGETSSELSSDVAVDNLGNVYMVGYFYSQNVDFNSTGIGPSDIKSRITSPSSFITKYNADGSYGWTRVIGGYSYVSKVATDLDGNVYMTGYFTATANFNTTGSGNTDTKYSDGNGTDIFITKYNADGSYGWTRTISGTTVSLYSRDLYINNDSIFFVGFFQGANINFNTTGNGDADLKTSVGTGNNAFITKYNIDGSYSWTRVLSATSQANGVSTDLNGNLYYIGAFSGSSINFNTTGSGNSDLKNSNGGYDIYVTKLNSDGSYGWTRTIGGSIDDSGKKIINDTFGNIYFSGHFQNSNVNFNTTGSGTNDLKSSNGGTDVFLTKLNSDGSYGWTRTFGGTNSNGDAVNDIAINQSNEIFLAGDFRSPTNFNTTGIGGSDIKPYVGDADIYVTKFNSDGSYGWTRTIGSSLWDDANGITSGLDDSLYVVGLFQGTNINFNSTGAGNPDLKTSKGGLDLFIMKYGVPSYTVSGVVAGITPLIADDWSTNISINSQSGVKNVGIVDGNSTNRIASFEVNFSNSLDWSNLKAESSGVKSLFHYPGGYTSLPGASGSSYILYVPKGDGTKVWICPGVDSLSDVSLSCSGGYYLDETSPNVTVATEGGIVYWKVSGLTGTGGMSVVTGLRDTLSRLQSGVASDHTITFGTNNGLTASGQYLVLAFDPSNKAFDLSTLTLSDIKLTDNVGVDRTLGTTSDVNTWGVEIDSDLDTITFFTPTSGTGYYPVASQIVIKIGINAGGTHQIFNPSQIGSYEETIYILNTDIEGGTVQLPIIDSDRVDITGYVTAYIHFDIDTGVGEVPGVDPAIDCEFNLCTLFGGTVLYAPNYTVDLGELTSAVVNKSNTTSVVHSNGQSGVINSIYFDISTNAPSGAVVTVKSANGGLQGPGTNKIPSIGITTGADGVTRSDGDDIPANSGVYGYTLPVASSQIHGTIIPNSLCDSAVKYCGADNITPKTVFTTNNLPVDTARVRMDLAAAANYTNNPGSYTDTLTFVATATF